MTHQISIIIFILFSLAAKAQNITTIAGTGISGHSGDGGVATAANLQVLPRACTNTGGLVCVGGVSSNRIRHIDSDGIITTIAGISSGGFSGDGGFATSAQLNKPFDAALDTFGNILIIDYGNYRIRHIDRATGIINTIAGSGIAGSTGDGGPATLASITPYALCVDKMNNIYFIDNNGTKVRKIDHDGTITTIAGTGIGGFTGDGGPATNANLTMDYSICIDSSSNYLYLACNTRIRRINISTGIIETFAGTGASLYTGDNIPATSASFNVMTMCIDQKNNWLFIFDIINDRVHRINHEGIFSTIAGTGTAGYSGDGGLATAAQIFNPEGGVIDNCGNLIFGDKSNNRIRKVTYHPYATPSITISGVASATVGATVTLAATVTAGAGSYTISWLRNGVLLATTSTPSFTYTKGAGTDTITARLHPTVAYCSDTAASTPIIIAELPVGAASIQPLSAHIYPTPTTGTLHIQASAIMHQAQLQSLTGATLATYTPGTHQATISIAHLPPGIYTLRINHQYIYKVIKQ